MCLISPAWPSSTHAQHRGVAHRLEPHLLHEPVADLLHSRAAERQAGQAHPHLLVGRDHRVGEPPAGLDDDAREGGIGPVAELLERHRSLHRLRDRLARLGDRGDRHPGGEAGQPLAQEVPRDEPARSHHARGGVQRDRLALDGGPGLAPDELRGARLDGEGPAVPLDRPGPLQQRGQVVGGDVGAAVVHHGDGEDPQAPGPIPHLDRFQASGQRHADEEPHQHAQQHARRQSSRHDRRTRSIRHSSNGASGLLRRICDRLRRHGPIRHRPVHQALRGRPPAARRRALPRRREPAQPGPRGAGPLPARPRPHPLDRRRRGAASRGRAGRLHRGRRGARRPRHHEDDAQAHAPRRLAHVRTPAPRPGGGPRAPRGRSGGPGGGRDARARPRTRPSWSAWTTSRSRR